MGNCFPFRSVRSLKSNFGTCKNICHQITGLGFKGKTLLMGPWVAIQHFSVGVGHYICGGIPSRNMNGMHI